MILLILTNLKSPLLIRLIYSEYPKKNMFIFTNFEKNTYIKIFGSTLSLIICANVKVSILCLSLKKCVKYVLSVL